MPSKNTICLWFNNDAVDAANFYAQTFPDSAVQAIHRAPGDYPAGKQGNVLTVEFTVAGIPCLGLNGGPAFQHNEAFSFQIDPQVGTCIPAPQHPAPSSALFAASPFATKAQQH